jgi:CRP-like cAMP-binding protein
MKDGEPAVELQFLIEGEVALSGGDAESRVPAPAALGFEDVLEGRPFSNTATALAPAVCLAVRAGDFLTMLSDNIELAQGVFRLLLASRSRGVWVSTPAVELSADGRALESGSTSPRVEPPLEKALRLRQTPLFGRATVEQLLALAGVTREIRFEPGQVLAADTDPPSITHVIAGRVRIERDGRRIAVVDAGGTVGAAETLAGAPPSWQVIAESSGRVLRLERRDLFEVLSEHLDLLQGLFSGVLSAERADAAGEEPAPAAVGSM